jgi:type IV secretory pathway VirB3-like protein
VGHQLRPVYKALDKPLTILFIDRRLFFCVVTVSAAVFDLFGKFIPGLVLFLALWCLARIISRSDPQMLRILINSGRFAVRYDPAKWSPTRLEKGNHGTDSPAEEQI